MQTLWMHRAMEQLQHLIVRRTCHNGVPRAEVMYQWKKIQQEMEQTIEQMDKEYQAKVDAISNQEATRDKPLLR